MAVNKRKVLDAARKYAQKGAKQKALKQYGTLLELDGRDAKLRLEIGDAHRRWGENDEAIGHYTQLADQFVQDGFDARAVAVYKQILNLDAKRYGAYVALSGLYQRLGLDAEAAGALQRAADGYRAEGRNGEALELLRKMAPLDPSNVASRPKVAGLPEKAELRDEAATVCDGIAAEFVRQGESGQAENVLQRVPATDPIGDIGQATDPAELEEDVGNDRLEVEDDASGFDSLYGPIEVLDPVAATRRIAPPELPSDDGSYEADFSSDGLSLADLDDDLPVDLDPSDAECHAFAELGESLAVVVNENSATAKQVAEDLEEAEFFFAQGMRDEAAQVYERILGIAPNQPNAMARLNDIASQRGEVALRHDAPTGPEVTQPIDGFGLRDEEHDDDSFDLVAALSDVAAGSIEETFGGAVSGTEQDALGNVFASFKQGVSEVLADGDFETRYDLAIAYKEMGLLDDAIAAFQSCVSCPTRGLDSLQLLAQCALDIGRPADAIGHLEQALSWENLDRMRRAGLHFDLAQAFAAAGDLGRARTTLEIVAELWPSFPGREQAVAELAERANSDSRLAAGEEALVDGEGEVFESFDEMVAEATAEQVLREVTGEPDANEKPRKQKKISFV